MQSAIKKLIFKIFKKGKTWEKKAKVKGDQQNSTKKEEKSGRDSYINIQA